MISLNIFIDAFGWEVLNNHPNFLEEIAPHRKKLDTIFGYSSACDPSIISGKLPQEHYHWSSFYYSPQTCPYKWVKMLGFLPSFVTENHRARHYFSKLIKKIHGFTGYFQVYQFPFKYLPYFDYAEKWRIWEKGGLNRGTTIFDILNDQETPYYVGDQDPEEKQIQTVTALMNERKIAFAYLLLGKLDALMHSVGTRHDRVSKLIDHYDKTIKQLIATARNNYGEVNLNIFSDHGMHNVHESYDLEKEITKAHLTFGVDYAAVYDSTMARFWFLNPKAKQVIEDILNTLKVGQIVTDEELKKWGVFFPDRQFGEMIFLMNSSTLIVPSFMGAKQIPGMHGYHPDDSDSAAMLLSNREIPNEVKRIEQIYSLLLT